MKTDSKSIFSHTALPERGSADIAVSYAGDTFKRSERLLLTAAAGLCAGLIFTLLLIVLRIAPFGDRTLLIYDMKRQYVDFYGYLDTLFAPGGSFFYSFSNGLGGNLIGLVAYYLTSPLLLPFIHLDGAQLPAAVSLMMLAKTMLLAASFAVFLLYTLPSSGKKEKDCLAVFVPSVTWAISCYMISNISNTMWMDALVVFPLLILCFRRKWKFRYILCCAGVMFLNYYIGFMALLFTGFLALLDLLLDEGDLRMRMKRFIAFCLATLEGALLPAFLLVPTFLSLASSPRDSLSTGFAATGSDISPWQALSRLLSLTYHDGQIYQGMPPVGIGLLPLIPVFACLFSLQRGLAVRQKAKDLAVLLLLMFSFCLDALGLIWHAGSEPSGYHYRFAFLFVFFLLTLTARFLSSENTGKTQITGCICAILFVAAELVFGPKLSGRFAFYNMLLICCGAACLVILSLLRRKNRKTLALILTCLLLLAHLGDLALGAWYTLTFQLTLSESASGFAAQYTETKAALEAIPGGTDGFFRIENEAPRSENDSFQHGYMGVTAYSSAQNMPSQVFMVNLGYNDNGFNTRFTTRNTIASQSILGVRYLLQKKDGQLIVTENPSALPVLFATDLTADELTAKAEEGQPAANPFVFQEHFLSACTGEDVQVFREVPCTEEADEEGITCSLSVPSDGRIYFYMEGISDRTQDLGLYLGKERISGYGNRSAMDVVCLGEFQTGNKAMIRIQDDSGSEEPPVLGRAVFVQEDLEALAGAASVLQAKAAAVREKAQDRLVVQAEGGNALVLTFPEDPGWEVLVDGKAVTPLPFFGAYMAVPLPDASAHEVKLTYRPEGFLPGCALTAVLCVLFLLQVRACRKRTGN